MTIFKPAIFAFMYLLILECGHGRASIFKSFLKTSGFHQSALDDAFAPSISIFSFPTCIFLKSTVCRQGLCHVNHNF